MGMPTVFGAELSLGLSRPQNGEADPEGHHLLVLARDPEGYARLASTISTGHLAGGEKGRPDYSGVDWAAVHGGHWLVLTGCRKGAVPRALVEHGPAAAARELDRLVDVFGADNVVVELCDHGDPLDSARNDALATLAVRAGLPLVATNNVHYAAPARRRLATALAAVRARRSLDDLAGWLPAAGGAHLRSGDEQARRFARWPGAVELAAELGRACAFDLALVAPRLPPFPCPDGLDEMTYLRRLVEDGGARRYGPRGGPPPTATATATARPGPRSTTSSTSSRRWGSPATSSWCGTSSSSAAGPTSTARVGAAPPTRRSATPSASPTPTRWRSACCSSGSCRPSATARPTSTSTSRAGGGRRPSSTSTAATGAGTPPRWPTSSATGPARRCATWPRRSATRPASRTPGRSRWTCGRPWRRRSPSRAAGRGVATEPRHPRAGAGAGPRGRAGAPPPGHPLGGHGHLRPAHRRGVPGRVGPVPGQGRGARRPGPHRRHAGGPRGARQ